MENEKIFTANIARERTDKRLHDIDLILNDAAQKIVEEEIFNHINDCISRGYYSCDYWLDSVNSIDIICDKKKNLIDGGLKYKVECLIMNILKSYDYKVDKGYVNSKAKLIISWK